MNYIVLYESADRWTVQPGALFTYLVREAGSFHEAAELVDGKEFVKRVVGVSMLGGGYPLRPVEVVTNPSIKVKTNATATVADL